MNKEEKEHKLKLISLIMIVNFVKWEKTKFKDIKETFLIAAEQGIWRVTYQQLIYAPTFEKGCVVTNSNENPEMIITKNGTYPMLNNLPKDTKNK